MALPKFISIKWQIFVTIMLAVILLFVVLFVYWQNSVKRVVRQGEQEAHRTMTMLTNTLYFRWKARGEQSATVMGNDRDLAILLAGGIDANREEIGRRLDVYRRMMNATLLDALSPDGKRVTLKSGGSDAAGLSVADTALLLDAHAGVACDKNARCWEVIRQAITHHGAADASVTIAVPLEPFFKILQAAPYLTGIRVMHASAKLPDAWIVLDESSIPLPAGFRLAMLPPPPSSLQTVLMATRETTFAVAAVIVLVLALLLAMLFHGTTYIKRLAAAFPVLLDGDPDQSRAETLLDRGKSRMFRDELDLIADGMRQAKQKLALNRDVPDSLNDTMRLKLSSLLAGERKALLVRYASKEEETRRDLAHDLHDEIGGRLVSMKVDLRQLKQMPEMSEEAIERLDRFERNCIAINRFVHSTMEQLSPSILVDFGLAGAITHLVDEWRTTLKEETSFHLILQGNLHDIPFPQATAVYRVTQEAMTNVAKHAQARHVTVKLVRSPSAIAQDTLLVDVEDDGKGFDDADSNISLGMPCGRGLHSIRDRIEGFGGTVLITSTPGQGTHLVCLLPLSEVPQIPSAHPG